MMVLFGQMRQHQVEMDWFCIDIVTGQQLIDIFLGNNRGQRQLQQQPFLGI
ncbi:MAG: hypothetical protein LBH01_10855 [Verrucomicrobiales bacterium]|nr:hypothetical protein [Verrucomicrobiales bacterium]